MSDFTRGLILGGILTLMVQAFSILLFTLTVRTDRCDDPEDDIDPPERDLHNHFPTRTDADGTKRNNDTSN